MKKTVKRCMAVLLVLTLVFSGTPLEVSAGHAWGEDHDWFCVYTAQPTCEKPGIDYYQCYDCGEFMEEEFGAPLGHNYVNNFCTRCKKQDPDAVAPAVDIGGYTLYSGTGALTATDGTVTTLSGSTTYQNLVDGDPSTAWRTVSRSTSFTSTIDFQTNNSILLRGLLFTPGAETDGRTLPEKWALLGKYQESDEWTTIISYDSDWIMFATGDDTKFQYPVNDDQPYRYFRYQVTGVRESLGIGSAAFQLAELELYGEDYELTLTFVPAFEATCTLPAHDAYYLGSNGRYYADANGVTELDPAVLFSGEPLGHLLTTESLYTPPTCTERGYTSYRCSRCNEMVPTDYVPALGHDFDENGICRVCGASDPVTPIQTAVSYIDRTGATSSADRYVTLTSSITSLDSVFYYLSGSFTVSSRIEVDGYAKIILRDGATLTVDKGIHVKPGASLEIYGQTNGTGTIKITGTEDGNAAIGGDSGESSGAIRIYGGTLNLTGGQGAAAIGGGANGSATEIEITRGTVTASAVGAPYTAGAVIGGGANGGAGTIEISGGSLDLTCCKNTTGTVRMIAPGIGSAGTGYAPGTITISGGTIQVTPVGTGYNLIGTDSRAEYGHNTINISGGTIQGSGSIGKDGDWGSDLSITGGVIDIYGWNGCSIGAPNGTTYLALQGAGSYLNADEVLGTVTIGSPMVFEEGGHLVTADNISSLDNKFVHKILAHTHELTYHAAVPFDCGNDGSLEYWSCSCGMFYLDENGETVIQETAIAVPASGNHTFTHHPADPSGTAPGTYEYWECTTCGKCYLDENGVTEVSAQDLIDRPALTYLDENGDVQTVTNYVVVTPDIVEWNDTALVRGVSADGWYAAFGNVTMQDPVITDGNVKLILADGATMNVSGIEVHDSFTVYAQSTGNAMGVLNSVSTEAAGIGYSLGVSSFREIVLTFNGGKITAESKADSLPGIGGNGATVVINGGDVTGKNLAEGVRIDPNDGTITTARGVGIGVQCNVGAGSFHLIVNGGTVTAKGGSTSTTGENQYRLGTGIGGWAYFSTSPIDATIEINGGTVNATGGNSGAGIGGYGIGTGGTITINGGTVTAQGGPDGAGIGGGYGGAGGTITINDGIVTATGGRSGAGIGGAAGPGGTITINGGTVIATGGNHGAGIGGGGDTYGGAGGTITITGGTVTATGKVRAAGIGGGGGDRTGGAGGTITITGGTVTATGARSEYWNYFEHEASCEDGAGIGGGNHGAGGTILISGGTVTADGGTNAADIGGGYAARGGNITIVGGNTLAVKSYGANDLGIGSGGDTGETQKATVVLSWTTYDDSIKAPAYNSAEITFERSMALAGTSTQATAENIAGKTIVPAVIVSFDPGLEGAGTMENVAVAHGAEYTLPDPGFMPSTGYEFASWSLNGLGHAAGDTITVNEDIELVAEWARIHYTVQGYTDFYGKVIADVETAVYGQYVILTPDIDEDTEIAADSLIVNYTDENGDPATLTPELLPETDQYGRTQYGFLMPASDVSVSVNLISHAWENLQTRFTAGGTITLTKDYKATESDTVFTIPSGVTVVLDLNGHSIDRNLSQIVTTQDGGVFIVEGSLTITDSSQAETGLITGAYTHYDYQTSSNGGRGAIYVNGGTLVLESGTISGNNTSYGGGVYVGSGSSFTLNGGTISENQAWIGGSGVFVAGSFTMNGGAISGNTRSAGVYVSTGSFTLNGGSVIGNGTSGGSGISIDGGVYVSDNSNASFSLGGSYDVSGNTSAGEPQDIMLAGTVKQMTITGPVTPLNPAVLVTPTSNTGDITSGWKTNMGDADPAAAFVSGVENLNVALVGDELRMVGPHAITVRVRNNGYGGEVTADKTSAEPGETVTLTVEPWLGYALIELTYEYINGKVGNMDRWKTTTLVNSPTRQSEFTFPMTPADVRVTAKFEEDVDKVTYWGGGDGSEQNPYVISDAAGWDLLAQESYYWMNGFAGKYFRLDADITVTTSVFENADYPFRGIFDGNGHTITVDYTREYDAASNPSDHESVRGIAPFHYAGDGCEIKNLTVAGTIETNAKFAAGFISYIKQGDQTVSVSITNCVSSIQIYSTVSGDATSGGFVALSDKNVQLTLEDCIFDGAFVSENGTQFSGMIGYQKLAGGWAKIIDGLVVPGDDMDLGAVSGNHYTFCRHASGALTFEGTNYYTTPIGNTQESEGTTRLYRLTEDEAFTVTSTPTLNYKERNYYLAGAAVSATVTVPDNKELRSVQYDDGTAHELTAVNGVYSFNMPSAVTALTATVADHEFGEAVYEWSQDHTSVTATRVCPNDNYTETETVGATSEKTKDETCTVPGETTYTSEAFTNPAFTVQVLTLADIPAPGHLYGEPVFTWTSSGENAYTATATFTCSRDAGHTETVDAAVVRTDTAAAYTYTATAVFEGVTYEAVKTETRSYLITFEDWDGTELWSHVFAYGEFPAYGGTQPSRAETTEYEYEFKGFSPVPDTVSGTAVYTAAYTQTARTYNISKESGKGTIDAPATARYGEEVVLTVTPNEHLAVVRVQYLAGDFITIPPYGDGTYRFTMPARNVTLYADYECTGHQWDIIYRWTDDGQGTYSCHASSVCPWCYAYFSEYGTVTSEVIPQSCLDSGYLKYTATFEDPRCETQTHLVVTGPPLGHDYSNPSWDWVWREADSYYTVTMTVVCENDPSHVITKDAAVSLETTPEAYTYTASAEADGHTLTDVKVDKRKYGVTLNAGEHGTLGFGYGTGPEYEVGSSCPLTISIDDGYTLSSLTATGASGDPVRIIYASVSSGQIILAMPAEPVTVSATFVEPKTVTFDGDGKAEIYMVTAEGVRIADAVQTEFQAAAGSEITIAYYLNDIASRVTGVQVTGADSSAVTAVNVNKSENNYAATFTMPDQPVTVKVLTEPAVYPVVEEGLNPITIPGGEESGIFVFVPTTTCTYLFETFSGINVTGRIINREQSAVYEDNGRGTLNLFAPLKAGTTYYLMLNTFDKNPSVQYDNLSISRADNAYLVTADPNTRNGSVSVKMYPGSKPLTNELPVEAGQEIEVVPEAKPGCAVDRVTYQTGNGSPVEIPEVNGKYVFSMPASDVTVSAAFIALQPVFSGHQLVLSGQIGVRFGMELNMLTDEEKQASYVEFTVQGNTTRMNTSEAEILPAPDGRYVFTCYVNSIQMAETVTAVFHSGEYTVSDEYSVEAYIKAVDDHASQFSATVLNLTHGIADYGYHAQQFLSEVNHWTIGEDYAAMTLHYTDNYDLDQVKQEVTPNELVVNNEGSDVTGAMTRLVMATTTSLDIRMTVTDNSTLTASAEVHGVTYEAVPQSDGSYMISIPNIKASRLGETVTVTGNAGGAFTIQASPFSFVYSVLCSTTANERMKKAMAAMYYFYQTADAYQTANP